MIPSIQNMKMNVLFRSTKKMFTNTYLYNFEYFNFLFISHFALQKSSIQLPDEDCRGNYCMAMINDSSLYAVGCKSNTLLLDSRTLETIQDIPVNPNRLGLYTLILMKRLKFSLVCSTRKNAASMHPPCPLLLKPPP